MIESLRKRMGAFELKTGRRPRILLSKMGQDGHEREIKVIASAFADFGFDVDLALLFQIPEETAKMAIENDVHVIGIFSLVARDKPLVLQLLESLKKQGASDIKIVVGGKFLPQDYAVFKKKGASEIFDREIVATDVAKSILKIIGA